MFLLPDAPAVPTFAHDYPEWHKGRQIFSLWYLEIHSPALLQYLEHLQASFSDLLFQPNTRQFHITLFICGFLRSSIEHDDDITQAQIDCQTSQLQTLDLKPFQLCTGKINSFQSALFIEIEDTEQILQHIREQLGISQNEIAPLNYCPHITIGLYSHEFNSALLFKRIKEQPQQRFKFEVQKITFGSYSAQLLQGPLTAHQHIQLGAL